MNEDIGWVTVRLLFRWFLAGCAKDCAVQQWLNKESRREQVVHERPDGLDNSALFGKYQEAEQTDDSLSHARCSFSSGGVVKNEHIRIQFLGQDDGLRFPTAKLGAHSVDCSLVCDVVPHNPLGLADCGAPGPAMSVNDDFLVHGIGNMHLFGKLRQNVELIDTGEGDQGTGVDDQNHAREESWVRKVCRSC